jgi:hypothetical protein
MAALHRVSAVSLIDTGFPKNRRHVAAAHGRRPVAKKIMKLAFKEDNFLGNTLEKTDITSVNTYGNGGYLICDRAVF